MRAPRLFVQLSWLDRRASRGLALRSADIGGWPEIAAALIAPGLVFAVALMALGGTLHILIGIIGGLS